MRLVLVCALLSLVLGCRNDGVGEPCKATGSGFSMKHSCKTLCMSLWRIECPDGTIGDSNVCGGELNCSRGTCPTGQVCYQTNMDRSVCVPQSICPDWTDPAKHPKIELKTLKKRTAGQTTAPAAVAIDPKGS